MTDRKPQEIEREIEAERTALQQSIDALQAQFSPEALVNQATAYFKTHGSDVADGLTRTVKENPVPLILTGVGLAWLFASSRSDANRGVKRVEFDHAPRPVTDPLTDPRARVGTDPTARPAYDTTPRSTAPGFASESPTNSSFDARVRAAEDEIHRMEGSGTGGTHTGATENGGTTMSDRIQETWSSMQTRARDAKNRAYRNASDLRARLEEGTADLPAAARERVYRARAAAISAQEQVERRTAELARRARQTSYDNPLMVGAIAFAVGAAFGASLPRTHMENRAVGAQRDRLFDEAERIFEEETAKARRVAETMVAEGQSVVKDALSGNSDTPGAKSGVTRISEAGKNEAQKQRLGDVN